MDTFPSAVIPHKVLTAGHEFKTNIVEFDNDAEQRFGLRANPKHRYKFAWTLLTAAELTTLMNFFDAQMGMLKGWLITDSRINGGTQIRLRFAADKITVTKLKATASRAEVEVVSC